MNKLETIRQIMNGYPIDLCVLEKWPYTDHPIVVREDEVDEWIADLVSGCAICNEPGAEHDTPNQHEVEQLSEGFREDGVFPVEPEFVLEIMEGADVEISDNAAAVLDCISAKAREITEGVHA